MPRPRFHSLPPERRATLLGAAREELAAHGFEKASTNRIIARAGISKGSLYYYFDDKADLFLATVRDTSERVAEAIGPPPRATDAAGFWTSLEGYYLRVTALFAREPELAGLLKAVLSPGAAPGLAPLLAEFTARLRETFVEFLASGVALGAVRADVPLPLLTDWVLATGEAYDRWALERWGELDESALAASTLTLLALHRRLAAPLDLVLRLEHAGESP